MRCCYKDGISTYSVHVDTCSGLNVVEMNVTILSDKIDDIVFWSDLK